MPNVQKSLLTRVVIGIKVNVVTENSNMNQFRGANKADVGVSNLPIILSPGPCRYLIVDPDQAKNLNCFCFQ